MRLKRIELIGFKSFADKTIVEVEPGITAIVGPNGSGKSNIADAIRWVLGEQSAKLLRGSSMLDVIFSGTEKRKMLGYAEVILVLDNMDHILNVAYDEVMVSRRIYRSGESEYYINKTECRLKDVQELFMDTGVGKDGYSIIGQGKIEEIISSKSEERRNIFEEAAGIVKYRTRRDEAIKKLDNTSINLSRINDILIEIENNLAPTEEKSIKAKQYLQLKEELKRLEIVTFVSCMTTSENTLNDMNEKVMALNESIALEEQKMLKTTTSKEEARVFMEEIISEINNASDELYAMSSQKEKMVAKIDGFDARVQSMKNMIEKIDAEIICDNQDIITFQNELTTRTDKLELLKKNKEKYALELNQKEQELKILMDNMSSKEINIEELKQKVETLKEENTIHKVQIAQNSSHISMIQKTLAELNDNFAEYNNNNENLKKELLNVTSEYDTLCSEQLEKKNKRNEIEKRIGKAMQSVHEFEKIQNDLKQQLLEARSKLNYMQNLENENSGYITSVKSVIDLAKRNGQYASKVFGTLASIISTEEKYEKAIEVSLGAYLQNVVVDTDKTAKELISFLRDGMLGRATFLPLQSIRLYKDDESKIASSCEGYIGYAKNLVKFDPKFDTAVSLALGRTVIVDNIDNGVKMSKITKATCKIVTLSGEIIATTGSITGGESNAKSNTLVGRSRKLEKYKKRVEMLEATLQKQSTENENSNKEINSLNDSLANLTIEINELNIKTSTMLERKDNARKQLDSNLRMYNSREEKVEELEKSKLRYEEENAIIQEKLNLNIDTLASITAEIDEFSRFNKEKQLAVNILNEDIMNLKISVTSFDESKVSYDEMIEKVNSDISGLKEAIKRKKESKISYEQELSNSGNDNVKDKETVNILAKQIEEKKIALQLLKESQKSNMTMQGKLDVELKDSNAILEKLRIDKVKLEEKKEKYDNEKIALLNTMWEEYELTISTAKEYLQIIPEETKQMSKTKLEQNMNRIKHSIKELGEVSVSAIDEYLALKERHLFITTQKKDLEDTIHKLNNLVDNTTSIMKSQFISEFAKINSNFKQVFSELFGGGRAELILTDEKNILECGIEIEAQPPGKKLQNLSLLSGGERALTAICILFAILKLKAPPFCVLDEIEAALDDVNVSRFAKYIERYSKEAQFLVITHRKGTMEIAQTVYGVTMQEKGISTLVSMKLK